MLSSPKDRQKEFYRINSDLKKILRSPFCPCDEKVDKTTADGLIWLGITGRHEKHDNPVLKLHVMNFKGGE